MSKLSREAHRPMAKHGNSEGWWYDNARSIDVYVGPKDGAAYWVRISRRSLLAYIKRSEGRK